MHINVRDILKEELGYSRHFTISGEQPEMESVKLTKPIEGEFKVTKRESGLMVEGRLETEIELECHRCLRTFTRLTKVSFAQGFDKAPIDEDMPITDGQIDLIPVIEQEILVRLPIKILCRPDCPGVEGFEAEDTDPELGNRLGDRARIKKGS